ncbi:MAG: EF-P lysine aminoacylase EpmA [Pseudomonadota bacterium]
MTDWRPGSGLDTARHRAFLLSRARRYFGERGTLEVDVPALADATATDPNIESFVVDDGAFLQTSPEAYMKRLLAAGYPDIYSICRVFRRGETGRRHLREFTLIEWYRLGFDLDAIIEDTVSFIATVLDRDALVAMMTIHDYRDIFMQTLNVDPLAAGIDELAEAAGADAALRRSLGADRDAWLDLLLSTQIAPAFNERGLTVLRNFPASQASLARLSPDDEAVAERFEVFLGDLELANGFVELTDAIEQSVRMDRDIDRRLSLGRRPVPRDERLVAALASGLPACSGVAVGFERLHMIAAASNDIRSVVTFP